MFAKCRQLFVPEDHFIDEAQDEEEPNVDQDEYC